MTTNELIDILSGMKDELKQKFGIEEIALFGSYSYHYHLTPKDIDFLLRNGNE